MKPKPPCGVLIGSDDDEKKCGKESVDEITIKGRIGGGKVPVCHEHKSPSITEPLRCVLL
jgi:hypothetical protein